MTNRAADGAYPLKGGDHSFVQHGEQQRGEVEPIEAKTIEVSANKLPQPVHGEPSPLHQHGARQLPIVRGQEFPLDIGGALQEVEASVSEFFDLGQTILREEKLELSAAGENVEPTTQEGQNRFVFEGWAKSFASFGKDYTAEVDHIRADYDRFTDYRPAIKRTYEQTIAEMEKRTEPQFISLSGMAQDKRTILEKDTDLIFIGKGSVEVDNGGYRDWRRGVDFRVNGEPLSKLSGETEAQKKEMVQKLMEAGVPPGEMEAFSRVFSQRLTTAIPIGLGVDYPDCIFSSVKDSVELNLVQDPFGRPMIQGSMMLKVSEGPDTPRDKERYIKVDILVVDPGSDDPNFENVHFCLSPVIHSLQEPAPTYTEKLKGIALRFAGWVMSFKGTDLEKNPQIQAVTLKDGANVGVTDLAVKDWPRGEIFCVAGKPLHDMRLEDQLEEMRKIGVKDNEIKVISHVFNQSILNEIPIQIQTQFETVTFNALEDQTKLNLTVENGQPVIQGSVTYQIRDMEDMLNVNKIRYMKVDILVDNLASGDPAQVNVRYSLGPLTDKL